MTWLQWLLCSILLLVGGSAVLCNWGMLVETRRSRKGVSLVPLIGGVLVAAACLVAPAAPVRGLWWVPRVVDLGCVPMLAFLLYGAVSRQHQ